METMLVVGLLEQLIQTQQESLFGFGILQTAQLVAL
jgi:hypothetical protein